MKIDMICYECFTQELAWSLGLVEVDVRDDGLYRFTCAKGHESFRLLRERHFEILFEIGVNAIVDGYYREAVSSFAAALERFYEFSLRVFMRMQGITGPTWDAVWKLVDNQSEHQAAAYAFAHTTAFRRLPKMLKQEPHKKFRNTVIHKGKIPDLAQVVDFGEAVREILNSSIADLYEHCEPHFSIEMAINHSLKPDMVQLGQEELGTTTTPTLVSTWMDGDSFQPDVTPLLEVVAQRKLARQTRS